MDISFATTSTVKGKRSHRPYRSSRRRYRGRDCAAARRAFAGAELAAAATDCGSNVHYVRAALILIETNNTVLIHRATIGDVTLLKAVEEVRRLASLVKAYRTANAEDHVAFAKIVGPATIFDNMVVPAI